MTHFPFSLIHGLRYDQRVPFPRRSFLKSVTASAIPAAAVCELVAQVSSPLLNSELHVISSGQDRYGEQHTLGYSSMSFKVGTQETGGNMFIMEHRNPQDNLGKYISEYVMLDDQRAKYYSLTKLGKKQLASKQDKWKLLVQAVSGARAARKCKAIVVLSLTAFLLMLVPFSAFADDVQDGEVTLQVCNKGKVGIQGVEVSKPAKGPHWQIMGWIDIPAGSCSYFVAERDMKPGANAWPSYLGFAFRDSTGTWGAANADVPAYGADASGNPTFSQSGLKICVSRADDTFYSTDDDSPGEHCSALKLDKHPDEKLVPFTMALYFRPVAANCNFLGSCSGGAYYLDIAAPDHGRQLHVVRGLSPTEQGMQVLGSFLKAVINAADAQNKQRAQAAEAAAYAASPEGRLQHARELQADREKRDKQILAADAAGNPNVKVEAQMVRREQQDNRQRWAGTRQSPAAYDPQWMGQSLVVTGTVSRVEVDPNGSPNWVTIYFKESPNATFVVCSPYPDVFQERVGLNLNALVGKTLQAAGQVESPYCGGNAPKGSIRVVESTQWQIH